MRTKRTTSSIVFALVLLVILLFGVLNSARAQQPAPTATLLPATTVLTAPPSTPTSSGLLLPMATPVPLPTATPTIWDLLLEFSLGEDRALILKELQHYSGWPAVLVGVLLSFILPFFWKPIREEIQEWLKGLRGRAQGKGSTEEDGKQRREELDRSTEVYLDYLRRELARTDIVPIPNAYATTATRAYVPLQVDRPNATGREAVFAALGADRSRNALLLIGDAGSGKSHTLRFTALVLAESWPSLHQDDAVKLGLQAGASLLPVYVRLQGLPDHQQELRRQREREPTLLEVIDHHLYGCVREMGASIIQDFVSSHVAAQNERCFFLFDGLDEIDSTNQRRAVQEQIVRLQRDEPSHIYVVMTRPLSDLFLGSSSFAERRLCPLQPEQMQHILAHWYRDGYGSTPLVPEVEQQVEQQASNLLATILHDPDLKPMAPNPLFLTAMVRLTLSGSGLPRLRVQKYRQLVDLLLEWRRNRLRLGDRANLFAKISHRDAIHRLAELAVCMLYTERERLTLDAFLHGTCRDVLPTNGDADELDFEAFEQLLRSVVLHTGLMVEVREGGYRFTYGFRDYLAALAMTRFADLDRRLFDRRAESAWRTVIMLAVGYQATTDPRKLRQLFTDLLNDGKESTLLAAEALCEVRADGFVRELEPERRKVLARLRDLGEGWDLIRRLELLDQAQGVRDEG